MSWVDPLGSQDLMCLLPQLPRRRRLLLLLYWSGVEGGNRVNGLILVLLMKLFHGNAIRLVRFDASFEVVETSAFGITPNTIHTDGSPSNSNAGSWPCHSMPTSTFPSCLFGVRQATGRVHKLSIWSYICDRSMPCARSGWDDAVREERPRLMVVRVCWA